MSSLYKKTMPSVMLPPGDTSTLPGGEADTAINVSHLPDWKRPLAYLVA